MDVNMLTPVLEKTLRRVSDVAGLVGGALSVVKDGKIIYTYNYGYADRENQIPFTQDTLCDVASTSKAWTTMLAAKAIDLPINAEAGQHSSRPDTQHQLGDNIVRAEIPSHRSKQKGAHQLHYAIAGGIMLTAAGSAPA